MTIFRDQYGIPHVRAESLTQLAFEQGRVTAADRGWQIQIERLRAEGRCAALLGPAGLEWDVFARRAGIAEVARRAFADLDDETRAFVTAYADGVGAPEPWEPWTPLGVFLVQHILFATFPSKLWRHRVASTVGADALRLLRTEGLSGGSNALVVGPDRTSHGHPIVAGDPHRLFEAPNVYQQVRLACPEFDVAGFTFPGVPGVQHFAHTGEVAWAITNAMADYQDLYPEQLSRRDGGVWAHGGHGWERAQVHHETVHVLGEAAVEVEVVVTERGPVVVGGPDEDEAFSLRTPSYVLGDLGFGALLPLLRSRTVEDVDSALGRWVEPVNNAVIADRQGTVLHRVAGRVPDRAADGHWDGWVTDPPRTDVARDGTFVTANDRGSDAYARIGDDFAPPFRAERIRELLGEQTHPTAAEVVGVLADTRQNAGEVLLRIVEQLRDLSAPAALVSAELLAWDRLMTAEGRGSAWFAALRERVVERICDAEPLAPLRDGSPYGELFDPWFSLPPRIASSLHVILSAEAPFGLDVAELVRSCLEDVAAQAPPPTWGSRHVFHPLHALEQFGLEHSHPTPSTPLPGDSDTVLAAGFLPGTGVCVRGPVARYVWDLADRDSSGWVVPLGSAGEPTSPHHHDQHDAWAAGGVVPLVTDWARLTEEPDE